MLNEKTFSLNLNKTLLNLCQFKLFSFGFRDSVVRSLTSLLKKAHTIVCKKSSINIILDMLRG